MQYIVDLPCLAFISLNEAQSMVCLALPSLLRFRAIDFLKYQPSAVPIRYRCFPEVPVDFIIRQIKTLKAQGQCRFTVYTVRR